MTENESRMQLGASPSETALRLYENLGHLRATEFVGDWIKRLASRVPLPVKQLAFFTDVAMRLSGLQPTSASPSNKRKRRKR